MPAQEFVVIPKISRADYRTVVGASDSKRLADALLSIAYWEDDWRWAEQELIEFSSRKDCQVLWAVVTGFAYLAIFNGEANLEIVIPVLDTIRAEVSDDSCICSADARNAVLNAIDDSLEDLDYFVSQRRGGAAIELGHRLGAG